LKALDLRRYLPLQEFIGWFNERLYVDSLLTFLRNKTVPNHKYTFWYLFGGLTLFLFVVQLITGGLLLFYYQPTPETAYESVKDLITNVSYGKFVRSLHIWTSHFMVVALMVHMFSVYFLRAYRKPREAMWFSGFVLMLITLGFAFTGYLLPWDTTAYFATQIGTEIPRSIPLIGQGLLMLLRGDQEVSGHTLTRLFALHVFLLPVLALLLVALHLILNQIHGSSKPIGVRETGPPIPFFPNFVLRDWTTWLVTATVLAALSFGFPWGLGPKADPISPAPPGIRPEWYFWSLYETLRLVPSKVWLLTGEALVNVVLAVVLALWFFVPALDRKALQGEKSRLGQILGVVLVAYLAAMTLLGGLH